VPEEVDVLPGEHTLEAGGRRVTVSVAAGEAKDVDFSAVTPPFVPPPPEVAPSFWTTRHAVGVTLGGLAVVAAGFGGAFLLARAGHVSDGKDALAANPRPCAQPSDPACGKYDGARDGITSTERGAVVSFGASAALGATAAMLILWPEHKREARLRLVPVGRGLSLLGTF
jgi:hypothetical protein